MATDLTTLVLIMKTAMDNTLADKSLDNVNDGRQFMQRYQAWIKTLATQNSFTGF